MSKNPGRSLSKAFFNTLKYKVSYSETHIPKQIKMNYSKSNAGERRKQTFQIWNKCTYKRTEDLHHKFQLNHKLSSYKKLFSLDPPSDILFIIIYSRFKERTIGV